MADFYATNHDHGGGAGSGVTSVNGLSGAVVLAAGANITLTPVGNTITIAASGGGGGANTALSNLASVAINTPLLSSANGTMNFGSFAKRWNSGFLRDLRFTSATQPVIDIENLQLIDTGANTMVSWDSSQLLLGLSQLQFPAADGSAGQFLKTNGAGLLSFASAAPTGTANTFAFFDSGGALTSTASSRFYGDRYTLGAEYSGGTLNPDAGGNAVFAFGYVNGSGATIHAAGQGALAGGNSNGVSSKIEAATDGAFAWGKAGTAGQLLASQVGSIAFGIVVEGTIAAVGTGSMARGFVQDTAASDITANGFGTSASGYVSGGARSPP